MYSARVAVLCCSIAFGLFAASASAALPQVQLPEVPLAGGNLTQTLVPSPVAQMVSAINGVRARRGLRPLRPSGSLRHSATRYAAWMLRAHYFGHRARIHASRRYHWLGEAIAIHTGMRSWVHMTVVAWLRSPPHRRLLLSRRFRYLGAGMSRGRFGRRPATTWVLHFGA